MYSANRTTRSSVCTCIEVSSKNPQIVGSDVGENKAFTFTNEIVDVDDTWLTNRFTTSVDASYKMEINYTFEFVKNAPTDVFPVPPRLRYFPISGGFQYVEANTIQGWPDTPQEGTTYTVTQVWNLDRSAGDFEFVYMVDQPGGEADLHIESDAYIKIYKLA